MPPPPKRKPLALRRRAARLHAQGRTLPEIAAAVGRQPETIRRWLRADAPASRPTRARDKVTEMLRADAPAVARVILDMAKGGDVRAAALVVRLLGTTLNSSEDDDDADGTAAADLERELTSLPPDIAAEIVGLLAQADSARQARRSPPGAKPPRPPSRSSDLPWQEEDRPPDQGEDPL